MIPYDPSRHIPINKSFGIANGLPLLAKSYFQDYENYTQRPFNSREEAIEFIPKPVDRGGRFPVYILENGVVNEYWWKDGTADDQLILKQTSGGVSGGVLPPYNFTAASLANKTTIPLPDFWTHTPGDQYQLFVVGFEQDFTMIGNSLVLDEPIPATFTGKIIKYPNS